MKAEMKAKNTGHYNYWKPGKQPGIHFSVMVLEEANFSES